MIVSAGQDQDQAGISVAQWVVGETRAWAMREQIRIRMRRDAARDTETDTARARARDTATARDTDMTVCLSAWRTVQ